MRNSGGPVLARSSGRPDPWILTMTGLLVFCGSVFVLDTTFFYADYRYDDAYRLIFKHGISIVLGLILLVLCSNCGSKRLRTLAPYLMVISAALLLLTMVPGVRACANNACRWIPLGPMQFQPAEPVKIAFVITLAAWLTRHQEQLHKVHLGILPPLILMGALGLVLLEQPDFGTTALLAILAVGMMFLAGVPVWQVLSLGGVLTGAAAILIAQSPYRLERIKSWIATLFSSQDLDVQDAGWQLHQAKIAFGSGELDGIGLGASTQKWGWLPEAHTDFIFSVIGEETGLLGAAVILGLFLMLAARGYIVANRHSDMFGKLVAAGITLVVLVQALINIGVVLGLLPTKGIGLPFVSYGGSSMMIFLAAAGLLMSLSRELRER